MSTFADYFEAQLKKITHSIDCITNKLTQIIIF